MAFKFSYENDYKEQLATKVEFTVPQGASLDDMLEQFEHFLTACGYVFDGQVAILDTDSYDDEYDEAQEEWENDTIHFVPDEVEHSEYYYDTERNKTTVSPSSASWPFPTYGAAQPSYTMNYPNYAEYTVTFGSSDTDGSSVTVKDDK